MTRYRYLKKYCPPQKDFSLILKVFSVFFSIIGIFLVGNAVTPILSYQMKLSPKLVEEKMLSPLGTKGIEESFSISNQILGDSASLAWSADIKNWFPEANLPTEKEIKINTYYLSIPKLKINQAIVKVGVESLDKNLVHYPGTAHPGRTGNAVIFGHSVLPAFFNPKNYMTIFSTLPTIEKGEEILVDYDNIRYTYLVEELKEVPPNDISILAQRYDDSYLSLVTCVPPGTYLRRLVVKARLSKM